MLPELGTILRSSILFSLADTSSVDVCEFLSFEVNGMWGTKLEVRKILFPRTG